MTLEKYAKRLSKELSGRSLLLLSGSLGTGKTALTKKLLKVFNFPENKVKSPTFSLINRYQTTQYTFYHVDLYRLEREDPFLISEMKEFLDESKTVLIVEWPEKLDLSPIFHLTRKIIEINLSFTDKNLRKVEFCDKRSSTSKKI